MKNILAFAGTFTLLITQASSTADHLRPKDNQIRAGGNLSHVILKEKNFINKDLRNANFKNADLSYSKFSLELSKEDFIYLYHDSLQFEIFDLNKAKKRWEQKDLKLDNFIQTDLRNTDLFHTNTNYIKFLKKYLKGPYFYRVNRKFLSDIIYKKKLGAKVNGAKFNKADLSEAKLCCIELSNADFRRAKLINADLRVVYNAHLKSINFSRSNLSGADLSLSKLDHSYFSNANLNGALLRNTSLRNASLFNTKLNKSDLRGADLFNANLCKSDLTGANLEYANLTNADLWGANLSNASLTGVTATNLKSCPKKLPLGWICKNRSLLKIKKF